LKVSGLTGIHISLYCPKVVEKKTIFLYYFKSERTESIKCCFWFCFFVTVGCLVFCRGREEVGASVNAALISQVDTGGARHYGLS
jgi:hypothetical protein